MTTETSVDEYLATGLKDRWYPVVPSSLLGPGETIDIDRFGYRIVLWRDDDGTARALENYCPHRGAPLSAGAVLGDRLQCPYHGVEVRCDGVVTRVPGSPGCELDGARPTRAFPTAEAADAIFLYNGIDPHVDTPPPLRLPEQLTSPDHSYFICYAEWGSDYRFVIDNVLDPMHGAYLHKQSHSMSEGSSEAVFTTTDTATGFIFEKEGQRGLNFDWSEWGDTDLQWLRLEIPYPPTGGPGGGFGIIGMYTPIATGLSAVFHWRTRRVSGWQRDVWRFLYRNRLEARHWAVLEQDRALLENMRPDGRERLYAHDLGLVRARRYLAREAKKQLGLIQGESDR